MMQKLRHSYSAILRALSAGWAQSLALFATRIALAGVFWRAGRSKVAEGAWLSPSDGTLFLFENDYSGVPLPPEFAAHMAIMAETALPILIVLGLATRLSALGLLAMTMVIQIFVYPEAWWSVHILWVAMAAMLITHGAGGLSLDALIAKRVRPA